MTETPSKATGLQRVGWFIFAVVCLCLAAIHVSNLNRHELAEQQIKRAELMMNCMGWMERQAPEHVAEARPSEVYELALSFCNDYADQGGRVSP